MLWNKMKLCENQKATFRSRNSTERHNSGQNIKDQIYKVNIDIWNE